MAAEQGHIVDDEFGVAKDPGVDFLEDKRSLFPDNQVRIIDQSPAQGGDLGLAWLKAVAINGCVKSIIIDSGIPRACSFVQNHCESDR